MHPIHGKNNRRISRIIESAVYDAAQGVTFWLGYKSSFFSNHHVNEGAIVSEFALILQTRLPHGFVVSLETPYGEKSLLSNRRADLVVFRKTLGRQKKSLAIIEIKTTIIGRSDRGWKSDIGKLSLFANTPLKILILFTQGRTPRGLLTENGTAKRQSQVAAELGFKVKRVLRAAKTKSVFSKNTFNAIVLIPK